MFLDSPKQPPYHTAKALGKFLTIRTFIDLLNMSWASGFNSLLSPTDVLVKEVHAVLMNSYIPFNMYNIILKYMYSNISLGSQKSSMKSG